MRRMKPEVMEKLAEARDFYALTRTILLLCEPFGAVHSFRFVHNPGAARVACFIELESPKQEMALARTLGARINGSVCLDIPVDRDFGKQRKVVAIAPEQRLQQPPAAVRPTLQVSG